ncbi:antibiotic resistance protein VanZ [Bacteroidales bacterium OttesenSCG-928-L03]|nr:antibiotic resistance protein VanZ [Bacteroidales bacterium OttesenSCG-928-L03]
MRRIIRQYGISLLLAVIILVLCLIDTTPLPKAPMTGFDKLVHLLMFLAVSGVAFFENTRYFRRAVTPASLFVGSFLYPLLFGGLIEVLQEYLSTTRSGDRMDFLYDGIGALVGFTVCLLINRYKKKPDTR